MAKKRIEESNTNGKVITKYDRKMQAKKLAEEKEKKEIFLLKLSGILIALIVVLAVVGSIVYGFIKEYTAINKAYVKFGDVELTQQEYDVYYYSTVNSFLTQNKDFLPFLGLDLNKSFEKQVYQDDKTWDDYFDQITVGEIQKNITLLEDSKANNFTYDTTNEINEFMQGVDQLVKNDKISKKSYYEKSYGEYATEKVVIETQKDIITVSAYLDHLKDLEEISQEEIDDVYNADKNAYDSVDYYSFTAITEIDKEAAQEDKDKEIDRAKKKIEEFKDRYNKGEDFKKLCLEYATDEQKPIYEENGGLFKGLGMEATMDHTSTWLFDSARKADDQAVLENTEANNFEFIVFDKRYKDDDVNSLIEVDLINQAVTLKLETLMKNYEVVDIKGDLKYLTIQEDVVETTDTATEIEGDSEEGTTQAK